MAAPSRRFAFGKTSLSHERQRCALVTKRCGIAGVSSVRIAQFCKLRIVDKAFKSN